ncbi:unnamed protein product [Dibothriocephalus latus]|uniref:Ionotropic glutamate receptor C-terminal domain-containing protein n=1 Tax=Dibothriocephalus latus TaxID=60516 RepID=A0A3P7NZL9_DIBLA|nr:unnamed protein product [Dibothriocephalus latus]
MKAFIWDSARLNYEASHDCELVTAGEVFGRTGYALAMKPGNPWLYELSQAVLSFHERELKGAFLDNLREYAGHLFVATDKAILLMLAVHSEASSAFSNVRLGGFMETLDTQWIFSSTEVCANTESSPATLELPNMAGVFIMVAVGIITGLLLLLIEIACDKRRSEKKRRADTVRTAGLHWRQKVQLQLKRNTQSTAYQPDLEYCTPSQKTLTPGAFYVTNCLTEPDESIRTLCSVDR